MKFLFKTRFYYKLVKSLAKKIGFSLIETELIKFNGWGLISQRDLISGQFLAMMYIWPSGLLMAFLKDIATHVFHCQ